MAILGNLGHFSCNFGHTGPIYIKIWYNFIRKWLVPSSNCLPLHGIQKLIEQSYFRSCSLVESVTLRRRAVSECPWHKVCVLTSLSSFAQAHPQPQLLYFQSSPSTSSSESWAWHSSAPACFKILHQIGNNKYSFTWSIKLGAIWPFIFVYLTVNALFWNSKF